MTVEAIRLQNFMAFEDTGWIELRPITLLFGRNSSGKSAIIRALRLLKQSLNVPEEKEPLLFESRYGADLGSFSDMVHGGYARELVWFHFRCRSAAIVDVAKRHRVLQANFAIVQNDVLDFALGYQAHRSDDDTCDISHVEIAGLKIHRVGTDREQGPLLFGATRLDPRDATLRGDDWDIQGEFARGRWARSWGGFGCHPDRGFLPNLVSPAHISTVYRCLEDLVSTLGKEVSTFLRGIIHLGPIRPEPQRRYSFDRETAIEWRERDWGAFLDFIGGQLPQIRGDINLWLQRLQLGDSAEPRLVSPIGALFTEYEIGISEAGMSRPLPLSASGFGASQILPIVVQSLLVQQGSTVVIEQPELHLHPSAQATLGDLFIEAFQREAWRQWQEDVNKAKQNRQTPPPPLTPQEVSLTAPHFLIETHSEHLLLRLRYGIAQTALNRARGVEIAPTQSTEGNEDCDYSKPARNPPAGPFDPSQLAVYFVDRTQGASIAELIEIDEEGRFAWQPRKFKSFFSDDFEQTMGIAQSIAKLRQLQQDRTEMPEHGHNEAILSEQ